MKIIRSISIDVETWVEAKKLSNISSVVTSLLQNYLEVKKSTKNKEMLIEELEKLYKNRGEIQEKIVTLRYYIEKIEQEEQEQKMEELEKKNIEKANNLPLTSEEIQFFSSFNIKNLGNPNFLIPQKTSYMNTFGIEVAMDQLKKKIIKFKERK